MTSVTAAQDPDAVHPAGRQDEGRPAARRPAERRPAAPPPGTGRGAGVPPRGPLGILTITHEARRAEFGYLRTRLELTAGNLSTHVSVLEQAGLVEVEKGYEGRRGRTWITLTDRGRTALIEEVGRLKELIARIDLSS